MKVIFSPLPEERAKDLYKASEKKTLTTGNQSFIENLMLGKQTVYDIFEHTVPFIKSFIALALKINPLFLKLITNSYVNPSAFQEKPNPHDYTRDAHNLTQGMIRFFKLMESPALARDWMRLVQLIHDEHNFGERVIELLNIPTALQETNLAKVLAKGASVKLFSRV